MDELEEGFDSDAPDTEDSHVHTLVYLDLRSKECSENLSA